MDKGHRPERCRRHAVRLEAVVGGGARGGARTAAVTDLSLEGCRLSGLFRVGEQVRLRIRPYGTFLAEIRWAGGGGAGARFIRAIAHQALDASD